MHKAITFSHLLCTIIPGPSLPLSPPRIKQPENASFLNRKSALGGCYLYAQISYFSRRCHALASPISKRKYLRMCAPGSIFDSLAPTHTIARRFICAFYGSIFQQLLCVCLMVMASAAVSCCRTLYYITRGSICYANRVPAFFLGRAARLLLHRVLRGH